MPDDPRRKFSRLKLRSGHLLPVVDDRLRTTHQSATRDGRPPTSLLHLLPIFCYPPSLRDVMEVVRECSTSIQLDKSGKSGGGKVDRASVSSNHRRRVGHARVRHAERGGEAGEELRDMGGGKIFGCPWGLCKQRG